MKLENLSGVACEIRDFSIKSRLDFVLRTRSHLASHYLAVFSQCERDLILDRACQFA